MYGDKGPPKGYSVPRYDGGARRVCQHCSSTDHWSYECPRKSHTVAGAGPSGPGKSTSSPSGVSTSASATTARLSRTQMLKYGLKRKRAEFVPEPSEKEAYNAEMKAIEKALVAEVREEHDSSRKRLDEAKSEREKSKEEPDNDPDPTAVVKQEASPDDGDEGDCAAHTS